ncbi:GNAT family N-acetyltransferase [Streptomyces sp. NPDC018031]|uniref:GNAT family N-acetyltransferase n=1 Tax=Streptomyces sp. NPDC018031 TaxID=3365033 RepID=UPI00378DD664
MNLRFWRTAARHAGVSFRYRRSQQGEGRHAIVVIDHKDRVVGRLDYRICRECRIGYVEQIEVAPHCQRQGLGRGAVHEALAHGPEYHWTTSRQSADGRSFFAAMADETGLAFTGQGAVCPHLRGGRLDPPARRRR